MTKGISQEARALFKELERYAVSGRDYSPMLDFEAVELIETAMQSLINSTIERCAAVAETVVVGKPAYTHDDHRKPKSPSMTRIAIGQAIRQMKGTTNV